MTTEIYTVAFWLEKKFENNFIMSKVLFGVAQSKQNKNPIIITEWNSGSGELFSIKYSLLNINLYLKFSLLRFFFVLDDVIDLKIWRWRIEARHHTFKRSSWKWKFWRKVHV